MAYIVVGILIWIVAGLALAVLIGKAMHVADQRDRARRSMPRRFGNTLTHAR